MHRTRVKYVIEFIIHALFWLGVYYALKALTASSSSMVYHNGISTQTISIRVLFPYSGILLGALMLLFYSNTFWLFKKVIRYKSDLSRVLVITGWFWLVFMADNTLIRLL